MVTQRAEMSNMIAPAQNVESVNKGERSLTDSFQNYIANGNSNVNKTENVVSQNSKMKTEYNQKDAYDQVSSNTYSKNVDKVKNQMNEQNEKIDSSNNAGNGSDSNAITKEDASKIESEIRDVIKDTMEMSDEEIDEVLASMNISIFQLLQPEVLQEFVMNVTGTEPVDLITNSDLIQSLQRLTEGMTDILEEFDLSEADTNQMIENLEQLANMSVSSNFDSKEDLDFLNLEDSKNVDVKLENQEKDSKSAKSELGFSTDDSEVRATDAKSDVQVIVKNADNNNEQENHHSFENQGQNFATDVVDQLEQAVVDSTETTSYTSNVEQQEIVRQVVEQIRITSGSAMSKMQVQLYPEHLGRVEIQVMLKNGAMTAQIIAETEMAKAAIESQLQLLKESFAEKSIQVDAVEVSVGTPDFTNDQEEKEASDNERDSKARGRRFRSVGFEADSEETEDEIQSELEAKGASVEYKA